VSREKFPDGLEPLISYVNSLGMDFGIWVEPEMVNPDSDLFRAHPDWIYHFPGIEGTMGRNQFVLNLAKEEVQAFILDFMTKLLSGNNIAFIKWDMNRSFSEPGWMEVPESRQREIWVRHIQSIYKIWNELRKRFPRVIFESCAGGGSRIDLGIMRYADQFWPSDNTDAFDRLFIQEGFSYVYAPKSMMCWVTESPNYMNGRQLPLSYRFHSSMTGSVGIGGNLNKWSGEQMDEAAELVKQYKEIRHIVQEGELYRLNSPGEDSIAAVQYVSPDKCESVVFAFNHSRNFGEKEDQIYLRGLEPTYRYRITVGEDKLLMTGNGLMKVGIPVKLSGDFSSALIRINSTAE
jgi:alpha-galactosidase